mmetsp:Transcript_30301/g.72069  ORF Transcript_30301/g.72069 Transcript_30301/m.72069 type:complete len:456 (-) Transcript_30301:283-1650(-)
MSSVASCAHCGQHGVSLKCSRCLQASYCGAECQKAAWKGHKKSCASLKDLVQKVQKDLLQKVQAAPSLLEGHSEKELLAMAAAMVKAKEVTKAMPCCSHCGKQGEDLKRCLRCMLVSYCGAECQRAGWKMHKQSCNEPLDITAQMKIFEQVGTAEAAGDWQGVLKWEGRMNELLATAELGGKAMYGTSEWIIKTFKNAHLQGMNAKGTHFAAPAVARLEARRIELLGKMQRFRDQGEAMFAMGQHLMMSDSKEEAAKWFQKARDVGAAHGFFSVECQACHGLGQMAMVDGRHEEGLELLRNALAAVPLIEHGDLESHELDALSALSHALLKAKKIEEAEPLLPRYREAAKAHSRKVGKLCYEELNSLYASARLLEARGKPQEAVREFRVVLRRMRENKPAVLEMLGQCHALLMHAKVRLKVLDRALGDAELVMAVAAQLAEIEATINLAPLRFGP